MTAVIRPTSHAASFSTRLSVCEERSPKPDRHAQSSDSGMAANPKLSIIEVEAILRDKIRNQYDKLQKAFQEHDMNQNLSVTQGEFRHILESYCFPMTTEQFQRVMSKVDTNPNGTIRYCDFLDKFQCRDSRNSQRGDNYLTTHKNNINRVSLSAGDMNIDMIEQMLRDKLQKNMKSVMKSLRLFDYNRDGHIQKHELRKVLENNSFRLSDSQYDKLCSRYDFQHTGVIDYKSFLQRLGIKSTSQTSDSVKKDGGLPYNPMRTDTALRLQAECKDKNFDQIEIEFRQKMKSNHANLRRMFVAFDRHLDGFITLNDLRAVLNGFTVPMDDQLFVRLMERVGVRGTGKISWELFLDKFQDPQAKNNGQTIPLKQNHKFNPIRGVGGKLATKDMFRYLHKHISSAYPSLKEAFLKFDKNRNGKISRKELTRILESFKFRITDEEMKELMVYLDPEHTNFIRYHYFLHLFEERETKEGHKWLKSTHRYNDKQKPAVLAWDTVEKLLEEKISENWKDISDLIVKSDPRAEGMIPQTTLRKIIERFTLPVSDEHFESLVSRCDGDEKRVNYVDFMDKLGVDISPGDLMGLSTQIHENSVMAEHKRQSEHRHRQLEAEQHLSDRTSHMTVLEVISRLKDRMVQHNSQIRKSFNSLAKGKPSQISKSDFRKILKSNGFDLSDDHFQALCVQLDFTNGKMTYSDFVANFEDSRLAGPAADLDKSPNHKVNAIRGDEYGMSAIEVESKLRNKLRESFEDLRGAFYKFDDDHNGILTKKNFRRMLDTFMLIMSDEEFEKLCERLGIDKKSKISYTDFLERFEVRDTMEGHKWLISDHRYNKTEPVKGMTAEEVHTTLTEKAHRQWKDLAKAFRTMDRSGNGVITKQDLKEILYKFVLPMKKEEFMKLWKMYDTEKKGYLDHQDFLQRLGGKEFAPGDSHGISKSIVLSSYANLEEHHRTQQAKHELITLNQASATEAMPVTDILQQLKDKIRDQHLDFQTAFKKYDTRKRGYMTVNDVQKLLMDFNYFLDDDQFYDLLERIGIDGPNNRLTYEGFLAAFEEGRKDQYNNENDVNIAEFERFTSNNTEDRIREKVSSQSDVLFAAFVAFDQKQRGTIPAMDFRRILDNFIFKLGDTQFKNILLRLNTQGDDVDYQQFMDTYRQAEIMDAENWLMSQRRLSSKTPAALSLDDLQQRVSDAISSNFSSVARSFADADFARIGVVSKDDFSKILKLHVAISDGQVDQLWDNLKVNEFGNLDYREFLKKFSSGTGGRASALSRPCTADMQMYRTESRVSRLDSRISGRFTPLVNAESAEKRIREGIRKHWREIQRQCRVMDGGDSGEISFDDFKGIMRKYPSVQFETDDLDKFLIKYDLRNNNRFCYKEFLRHFMITMHSQNSNAAKNKMGGAGDDVSTDDAARRVRNCVSGNWKEMRRQFQIIDQENCGFVSPMEFRQVLRNYNVNLNENEFHSIISMCETDANDNICHGDFIKKFLKP